MDQTVLVRNQKQENRPISEVNVQENASDDEPPKKRTWTPAREEAWQKCIEGRKKYIETKKEVLEKEQEEKSIKEKIRLEMLKKKIREEIQQELQQQEELPPAKKKTTDSTEETQEEEAPKKENTEKKKKKKRVIIQESSDESSSEEEIIVRKRKKKGNKKKQYLSDSELEEDISQKPIRSKQRHSVQHEIPQPYFSRYSFV